MGHTVEKLMTPDTFLAQNTFTESESMGISGLGLNKEIDTRNGIGIHGKNPSQNFNKPLNIHNNICQADVDPLIVNISLNSGEGFVECMIDTGAGVSLLSEGAINQFPPLQPKLSSEVKALKGFGQKKEIPIKYYVETSVIFDSGFISKRIKFYLVPLELMTYNAVLGAVDLKDNRLVPDLTKRELLHRSNNIFSVIGKDISLSIPFFNCLIPNVTVIPPYTCQLIAISIPSLKDNSTEIKSLEFVGISHPCLNIIPGIIDNKSNDVCVAVFNPSEKEQHLRKNTVIGHINEIRYSNNTENTETVQKNVMMEEIDPVSYWTIEKLDTEFDLHNSPLSTEQHEKLISVLLKYPHVLSTGDNDVGLAQNITHTIELETDRPVRIPVRRFQGPLAQEIERECADLLESDIIRPSKSPYSAPVVPVRKPDGSLRLCIDYRKLNSVTKGDSFPLPNLIDMIYNMYGNTLFTTIDLIKGYYQVAMDPNSIEKTAFSTPFGQYEYLKMPFGVKNGPATFQRGMMIALAGLPWNKVMVYLDDIIVLGNDFNDHINTLEKVLMALGSNGYKLRPKKTRLCRSMVEFLGHRISNKGIQPLEKNLKGALEFPIPTTVKQLRQFLGMVNFYRRHIPNCSQIAQPLSAQTGGKTVTWTKECQTAFEALKAALINPTLLGFPDYTPTASPLELYVDASNVGAGACLSQNQNGVHRPIAYISTTFSGPQKNYSTIDKELTALRWAVKSLKAFLKGVKFVIYTDHQPLIYLQNMSMVDGRVARTWEELNEYNFEIRHITGKGNIIADTLSRSPVPDDSQIIEPDINSTICDYIPSGFNLIVVPGGGDALFKCFSMFLYGTMENHLEIRVTVVNELINHVGKYKLQNSNIRKRLKLMTHRGQVPIPEVIDSFCNLYKSRVEVYYDDDKPIVHASHFVDNVCRLKCLGGIHYNYLEPISVTQSDTNEILIKINEIIPIYGDIEVSHHNICELDIMNDQNEDHIIKSLIQQVSLKIPNNLWPEKLKIFKSHHRSLSIINDILYHYREDPQTNQYVISFPMLINIVLKLHWNCAHIGRNKLLELIYKYFWHPRTNQVVVDVVRCCPTCQRLKTHTSNIIPPTLKIVAKNPFDLVAMDLLQFPVTEKGNKYAMVFIDHCSKWANVIPIADKQSLTVSMALKERILPFLPKIPNRMLTDNGTEFNNDNFRRVLNQFNIKHIRTSPLHPSSNGICERFNRSLIQLLKCLVLENETHWDEEIPSSVVIYNHTWHRALKMSPSDYLLKESHVAPIHAYPQYWEAGTANFKAFKIGQKVAKKKIFKGHHVSNKFLIRWEGPFIITAVNDNRITYLIKKLNIPNAREERVHHSHLRKWIKIPAYLKNHRLYKEKAFYEDEEEIEPEDEDSGKDIESEILSDEQELDNQKSLREEEEEEFEGFVDSDRPPQNTEKILQMVRELQTLNVSNNSSTPGEQFDTGIMNRIEKNIGDIIENVSSIVSPVNLSNISPIPYVPITYSPELSSPYRRSINVNLCQSVFSPTFKKSRCSNIIEQSLSKITESELESEFSGFKNSNHRRKSSSDYSDLPNLEWDDSSLMDNYVPRRMSSPRNESAILDPFEQERLEENLSEVGDRVSPYKRLHTIMEESSNEFEEEITQSHSRLMRFLAENYQITETITVDNVDDLSPSYSVEGELFLKQKVSRRISLTGESIIESTPTLIIETPVRRPDTRSRGVVTEYSHVMDTPLEWRKKRKQ
ncbi:UNVERIFIED_CONTAM: hypothetical protein RMT77_000252 [Armadillidium vulgare]